MDIQKEREAFQKFCEENFDFERHEQTYFDEQTQCYENDIGEDTESINMAWSAWQAAKAQAVPEENALLSATLDAVQKLGGGEFVLVEREKLAMIFETATNALVYHAAPPKHDALSIIQGIARKAMVKSQEQKL
ncbi:hypothetical protein [Acinetobacter radioresistens]|uniref:hypothetical protein n=1 Tax=Acinetobacter radioresistens TaxID=40216 RepID=UPI00200667EF|nr:hypothetical protein [Acinetobacter radioresistens]MCK4081353.1 hypothetical protein [Acinetobacter radioresistens]